MRILVVDDHPRVRAALRQTLELEPDLEVVAEATDGAGAVQMVEGFSPDVVIMDARMPVMGGPEATRRITKRWPDVRVVALSSSGDMSSVAEMLDAGACGYVLKGGPPRQLLEALAGDSHDQPVTLDRAGPARP